MLKLRQYINIYKISPLKYILRLSHTDIELVSWLLLTRHFIFFNTCDLVMNKYHYFSRNLDYEHFYRC